MDDQEVLAGVAGDVDEEAPEPLAPPGASALFDSTLSPTSVPARDEPVLATGSEEELPLVAFSLALLASAFISQYAFLPDLPRAFQSFGSHPSGRSLPARSL